MVSISIIRVSICGLRQSTKYYFFFLYITLKEIKKEPSCFIQENKDKSQKEVWKLSKQLRIIPARIRKILRAVERWLYILYFEPCSSI